MDKIIGNLKGNKSEKNATTFLMKHGYFIVCTNYCSYYGEIDIIAYKEGIIHFFEVKSVTRVTQCVEMGDFSHETSNNDYLPFFNFNDKKLNRVLKTASVFIEDNMLFMKHWQINLVSVINFGVGSNVFKSDIKVFYNII